MPVRTGTPSDLLVVGLGNPGTEYEGTRHNAGAEAVRVLAQRHGGTLKTEKRLHASMGEVLVDGRRIMLAIPLTYMNESGRAVAALTRRAGMESAEVWASRLVVMHDELDLPSGRVKIKSGGGTAGNNGLKSIHQHLHTDGYLRVRIGIGKPPGRQSGADFVLRRPGATEKANLEVAYNVAADAVEALADIGLERAMNQVNGAAT